MAAALASNPEVGSSMKIIDRFATSSTAMVNFFRYPFECPLTHGNQTSASLNGFESLKFLQLQIFRSLEDWEVSSLQFM
ncbi:hypothetical protein Tco_0057656 [Tanacetum coccineum]